MYAKDHGLSHLRGHQQVLLCICNCEEILAVRKLVLESFGYEVLTTDSVQGIHLLGNQPVDIAILDYRAPDTNGELIAIKAKIIQPLTPIVMLVDDPATVPQAVARLIHAVITREYSPVSLLEEIAHILQAKYGHKGDLTASRQIA